MLREDARPLVLLFYGKLFEMDPAARRLFHNDIALQGQKLIDMLTQIVDALDDFQSMQLRLAELGRKHADYGVRPDQYETLTSALLWAIAQALFPFGVLVYRSRFLPRILGVWLMLNCFAYLATSITGMLWPQYEQRVSNWVFPVMLGELAMMLWLIIMGAKERQALPSAA